MNVGGEEPHVYLLVISDVRREPEREIKETENMFISLFEKSACWIIEAPAGH